MVINTMGWVDNLGYEILLHSIRTLRADVVIVVGQDRLHSQLRNELRSFNTLHVASFSPLASSLNLDILQYQSSARSNESIKNCCVPTCKAEHGKALHAYQ